MTWDVGVAWADGTPSDPDAFTAYVADRVRKIAPGMPVKITGSLSLDIGDSDNLNTLYLARLLSACQHNPDTSPEMVDDFVTKMVGVARASETPVTRDSLRIVVRPKIYLKQENDVLRSRAATPVTAPLAGDLIVLGASDLPTAIKMIDSREVALLHLSNDEAIALAKDNMRAELKSMLRKASREAVPGVNAIMGDSYESSLLAFPELWARLAKKVGGNLLVAAPGADVVLFSNGDSADAVATFRDAIQAALAHAERPVSENIFRWSAEGWIVLH